MFGSPAKDPSSAMVYITDMHWVPCYTSGGKGQTGGDVFALGSTDGGKYITRTSLTLIQRLFFKENCIFVTRVDDWKRYLKRTKVQFFV
jgi:hypothetical protein